METVLLANGKAEEKANWNAQFTLVRAQVQAVSGVTRSPSGEELRRFTSHRGGGHDGPLFVWPLAKGGTSARGPLQLG
jgi:hypothetical protein